jgi:hypothetical protein
MADETPTRDELITALNETVLHFQEHLTDDAHRANVPVSRLCPCWDGLDAARKLVKRAREAEAARSRLNKP